MLNRGRQCPLLTHYDPVLQHCWANNSVQSLSHVRLFATPWIAACQSPLSFSISQSLLKFLCIELVMLPNHLILCCLLFLWPSIFPSNRVFSGESALHTKWPNHWSFSLSISPFNEYSRLISFKMDWLNLHAVQETLKSLLQHHRSKASILQHSLSSQSNSCIHI